MQRLEKQQGLYRDWETWEAKNLEIENRIKTIAEGITSANLTKSEANAQKAVAEWNSAMAKAEVDQATKGTAIQTMKQNLINMVIIPTCPI